MWFRLRSVHIDIYELYEFVKTKTIFFILGRINYWYLLGYKIQNYGIFTMKRHVLMAIFIRKIIKAGLSSYWLISPKPQSPALRFYSRKYQYLRR